jgi:hypothetical protein
MSLSSMKASVSHPNLNSQLAADLNNHANNHNTAIAVSNTTTNSSENQALKLPLIYWNSQALKHHITTITATHNNHAGTDNNNPNYIVTGSTTGELVHWEVAPKQAALNSPPSAVQIPHYRPRALLFRQGSSEITSVAQVYLGSSQLFSVGNNTGYLTLWSATGGRCLRSQFICPYAIHLQIPFSSSNSKQSFIALANYERSFVWIVSVPKLQVVKVLSAEHHKAAIAHENSGNGHHSSQINAEQLVTMDLKLIHTKEANYLAVLYSLGYLSLYDLPSLLSACIVSPQNQQTHSNLLNYQPFRSCALQLDSFPGLSFPFLLCSATSPSCPLSASYIAIFTHHSVGFFSLSSLAISCLFDVRNLIGEKAAEEIIIAARFCAGNRLFIATRSGRMYGFSVNYENSPQIKLASSTNLGCVGNLDNLNQESLEIGQNSVETELSCVSFDEKAERVYCGFTSGQISIHSIACGAGTPLISPPNHSNSGQISPVSPISPNDRNFSRSVSFSDFPLTFPAVSHSILSESFNFSPQNCSEAQFNPVTARLLVQSTAQPLCLWLAEGHSGGNLRIYSLTRPVPAVEFHAQASSIEKLSQIRGNSTTWLISAAADHSLAIFNAETAKFHCHLRFSAPISAIFEPEMRLPIAFCFISLLDGSLRVVDVEKGAICSVLRGIPAPIITIFYNSWAASRDFLIILLENGQVIIFSIQSELIEVILEGKIAQNFLQSQDMVNCRSQSALVTQKIRQNEAKAQQNAAIAAFPAPTSANATENSNLVRLHHKTRPKKGPTALSSDPKGLNSGLQPFAALKLALVELNQRGSSTFLPPTLLSVRPLPLSELEKAEISELLATSLGENTDFVGGKANSKGNKHEILEILNNYSSTSGFCAVLLHIQPFLLELSAKYSLKSLSRSDSAASLHNSLLSLLFDWSSNSNIESLLQGQLFLRSPVILPSFGLYNSGSFTLLLPNFAGKNRRWQFDAEFSARWSLAINSICVSLLNSLPESSQSAFSKLFAYYNSILPEQLKRFCEPDSAVLALFSLNIHEAVHTAARLMLQATVERSSILRRQQLAQQWAGFYNFPLNNQPIFPAKQLKLANLGKNNSSPALSAEEPRSSLLNAQNSSSFGPSNGSERNNNVNFVLIQSAVRDEELMTALILCYIGCFELSQRRNKKNHSPASAEQPQIPANSHRIADLSEYEAKSQYIAHTLLRLIAQPVVEFNPNQVVRVSLACDLLATGLFALRQHIHEPAAVFRRLHQLAQSSSTMLTTAATRALLEAARISPASFLDCMGAEALSPKNPISTRQSAILTIISLIRKFPLALSGVLPHSVATIIRCLEPSDASLRKTLLKETTAALFELVRKYPSISVHQQTQRLAVGTGLASQCLIIIYDLRTATKWRILEGHRAEITAVSFNPNGSLLISYAALESPPTMRAWNCSSAGFLSGLLGIQGKCIATWRLSNLSAAAQKSSGVRANSELTSENLGNSGEGAEDGSNSGFGNVSNGSEVDSIASSIGGSSFAQQLLSVNINWQNDNSFILTREDLSTLQFTVNS